MLIPFLSKYNEFYFKINLIRASKTGSQEMLSTGLETIFLFT